MTILPFMALLSPVRLAGGTARPSVYGRPDDRKIGRAMATLLLHGGLLVGLIVAFTVVPAQVLTQQEPAIYNMVYLEDPGPGGGVPKPAEPLPTLVASIETTNAACCRPFRITAVIPMADVDSGCIARFR